MLTRRHLRTKVMQVLYARDQSESESTHQSDSLLDYSIDHIQGLYLSLSILPAALHQMANQLDKTHQKKYLNRQDTSPSKKLLDNQLLDILCRVSYKKHILRKYQAIDWSLSEKYVRLIYETLVTSDLYADYNSSAETDFEQDKTFFINLYCELIAPHDKLLECIEEQQLTWVDDYPFINTILLKKMERLQEDASYDSALTNIYKDTSDRTYAYQLLEQTISHQNEFDRLIAAKTINWDSKRIGKIDIILIRMALCEALYIEDIPVKVSINEYVDIAKTYATPKSHIFVNGILDKILKDLSHQKLLKKPIQS